MGVETHPLGRIYRGMLSRCFNRNHHAFKDYGGRGITVCDRWRDSFDAFAADLGVRPSPQHTIDRIDNDGNYEPANVRWATNKEQRRNSRQNVILSIFGRTQTQIEWCEEFGITPNRFRARLRLGWDIEKALTTPALNDMARITAGGETLKIEEWAARSGITSATIRNRLRKGLSPSDAVKPVRFTRSGKEIPTMARKEATR